MDTKKILSSLNYFSVFFAGILFPLVVLLAVEDEKVKKHAKSALLSHLITLLPIPILITAFIMEIGSSFNDLPLFFIIGVFVSAIITIVVVIWNIVRGIKVLVSNDLIA